MPDHLAYSTRQLAEATPFGEKYIRQCIHSVGGPDDPPPLKAKLGARGAYFINKADAQAWLEAHEEA